MNQLGFSRLAILIAIIVLAGIGLGGWYAYRANSDNKAEQTTQQTKKETAENTGGPECKPDGVIIVFFKEGTAAEQAKQIIADENVAIDQEFPPMNSYVLKVAKGEEAKKVDAFKKHAEVQSANINGCTADQG